MAISVSVNGTEYQSFADLSRATGIPAVTLRDRYKAGRRGKALLVRKRLYKRTVARMNRQGELTLDPAITVEPPSATSKPGTGNGHQYTMVDAPKGAPVRDMAPPTPWHREQRVVNAKRALRILEKAFERIEDAVTSNDFNDAQCRARVEDILTLTEEALK